MSGIKSLAERIERLERLPTVNEHAEPTNIIEKLLRDKAIEEENKRKEKYALIVRNYKEEIEKVISNSMTNLFDYISVICDATVLFVETYGPSILRIFELSVSGANKEAIAIELIKTIVNIGENTNLIKSTIKHMVVKNKLNKSEQLHHRLMDTTTKKKSKKSFFSMRLK